MLPLSFNLLTGSGRAADRRRLRARRRLPGPALAALGEQLVLALERIAAGGGGAAAAGRRRIGLGRGVRPGRADWPRWRTSSCSPTPRSSSSRCRRWAASSGSPRAGCPGWSTATAWRSAAACCSAGTRPTGSARGCRSCWGWRCSRSGRSAARPPVRRRRWCSAGSCRASAGRCSARPRWPWSARGRDPAERARALAVWSAAGAAAVAFGPVLGGALTGALGWRSVFWLPALVCLAAAAGGVRSLGPRPAGSGRCRVRCGFPGAAGRRRLHGARARLRGPGRRQLREHALGAGRAAPHAGRAGLALLPLSAGIVVGAARRRR